MKILEKYTGNKTYMFPNGAIATPDIVKAKYPAVTVFSHVIETDENKEIIWAIQNLSAMRTTYNIDKSLSEEEAISSLQDIINKPSDEAASPTIEERQTAALELIAMSALPDVEQ